VALVAMVITTAAGPLPGVTGLGVKLQSRVRGSPGTGQIHSIAESRTHRHHAEVVDGRLDRRQQLGGRCDRTEGEVLHRESYRPRVAWFAGRVLGMIVKL